MKLVLYEKRIVNTVDSRYTTNWKRIATFKNKKDIENYKKSSNKTDMLKWKFKIEVE